MTKGTLILQDEKIVFQPYGRLDAEALGELLKKYDGQLDVLADFDDPCIEDEYHELVTKKCVTKRFVRYNTAEMGTIYVPQTFFEGSQPPQELMIDIAW